MNSAEQNDIGLVFRKLANQKFPPRLLVLGAMVCISGYTGHRIVAGVLTLVCALELMRTIDKRYADLPNWEYFRDKNINIRKGFEEIRLFPELTNLQALKELMPYTAEDFWPGIPLAGTRVGYLYCTFWPNESYGLQNAFKGIKNSLTDFRCHLYVTDLGMSIVLHPVLVPCLYHLTFSFEEVAAIDATRYGFLLRISLKTNKHFILSVQRTKSYTNIKIIKYLLGKNAIAVVPSH